jgi:hypothetical protein
MPMISLRRVRRPIGLARWIAVTALLLVAACAAGDTAGNSDNDRNHGFYGTVTGGR